MAVSGVNHFVADDDEQAILIAKKLLSFLPQNNTEDAPMVEGDADVEYDPQPARHRPGRRQAGLRRP